MRITVRYSAQARTLLGKASEPLELAKPLTVREVVMLLGENHPELRRLLLNQQGEPHPSLLLFLDDEQVEAGSAQVLRDGDSISILPPIAGG
jgi:MoaD family protein